MPEKTVTISLRISERAYDALRDEAKKQNTSLNTLANQLLLSFGEFDRFVRRFHMVKLSDVILTRILEATSEDTIAEAGKAAGESVPQSYMRAMMGTIDVKNLLAFLKLSSAYGGAFDYSEISHDGRTQVTLTHTLGSRWSVFLENYISSMLKQMGGNVELLRYSDSVTFEV